MPLYMGLNCGQLDRLNKVIMTSARATIGSYCFKKSTSYILKKCNFLEIRDTIILSSMAFLYKVQKENINISILSFFFPKRERDKYHKLRPLHNPKMKRTENHLFHKGANIFNNLPEQSIQNSSHH